MKAHVWGPLRQDYAPQSYLGSTSSVKTAQVGPHLNCWTTSTTQPGPQGCWVWTHQLLQVCIIRADPVKAPILYSVPLGPPALELKLSQIKRVCDATPQAGPGTTPYNQSLFLQQNMHIFTEKINAYQYQFDVKL